MQDVKREVVGEAFLQWVEANKETDKNMKKMLKSFEGNGWMNQNTRTNS
jgi:hypothetical protein